uniref:3-octaprenyl-4-hydroxybenzoate carboxy-lyase n=1 Tax=Magnetococcus massalia (strain MO-1) TaxID=451514 RepID=A0A1S7LNY6_MAGMO|nr:3-octaprenyl-4-hydroxybenzoate carboxy-lyase [Candidatus Magnetococcus massalia]
MSASNRRFPKQFADLASFIRFLESQGELVRIRHTVDPKLEMTEIATRLLASGGPAVLFESVKGFDYPVLNNLFGTEKRVALAIGSDLSALEELGELLAYLRQPDPPSGGVGGLLGTAKKMSVVRHMATKTQRRAPWQQSVMDGDDVDLTQLPIQSCWPGDAAPLVTWPVVITQGPDRGPVNLGIYRMQLLGRNRLIMRWLKHRGGAQHSRSFNGPMPVAVAIGCDPGTLLAAVTPIPDSLSEYAFAGLLREQNVPVVKGAVSGLPIPVSAEIVLEGTVDLDDRADEGPYGDHTGYYNEVESFPVFTVKRISMRRNPVYLSTFTGRPPDEPSVLALALNRLFVPMLRKQFEEITAFHLPAEACSYRVAVIAMRKNYPGHAFRVMAGVWGFLRQFLYTKYLIVVDEGVDIQDWDAVMRAVGRHADGRRDLQVLTNTPIDYLDFASPVAGLGGKLGIDATTKQGAECEVLTTHSVQPTEEALNRWAATLQRTESPIQGIHLRPDAAMAVVAVQKGAALNLAQFASTLVATDDKRSVPRQIWLVDPTIDLASWDDLLWVIATCSDAGRDVWIDPEYGTFVVDATTKLAGETQREWGVPLTMTAEVVENVTAYWPKLGLPGPGTPIW